MRLDSTFMDENFMMLNLDRLLVSVRITAAARTRMNYRRRREIPACSDETEGERESIRGGVFQTQVNKYPDQSARVKI